MIKKLFYYIILGFLFNIVQGISFTNALSDLGSAVHQIFNRESATPTEEKARTSLKDKIKGAGNDISDTIEGFAKFLKRDGKDKEEVKEDIKNTLENKDGSKGDLEDMRNEIKNKIENNDGSKGNLEDMKKDIINKIENQEGDKGNLEDIINDLEDRHGDLLLNIRKNSKGMTIKRYENKKKEPEKDKNKDERRRGDEGGRSKDERRGSDEGGRHQYTSPSDSTNRSSSPSDNTNRSSSPSDNTNRSSSPSDSTNRKYNQPPDINKNMESNIHLSSNPDLSYNNSPRYRDQASSYGETHRNLEDEFNRHLEKEECKQKIAEWKKDMEECKGDNDRNSIMEERRNRNE